LRLVHYSKKNAVTPAAHPSNRLLARLPAKDRARIVAACVQVDLPFEEIVAESGKPIDYVYFPTGGFLSLLRPIEGNNIEVALAGDEGMFGLPINVGVPTSNVRALVQGAGKALRMTPKAFQRQLDHSAALRNTIGRYTYVLMTQFAQTVGCNRFHVVEQRLARWLLMTADRAHSDSFRITHEFLANMLGVRRAGVTTAARQLQTRGLIQYKRGSLAILDRPGLEKASCGCYRVNLETYRGVLG
jgi:CRP-like cAMP-binding protein